MKLKYIINQQRHTAADEILIVFTSYAIIHPMAMMIELMAAAVAKAAMLRVLLDAQLTYGAFKGQIWSLVNVHSLVVDSLVCGVRDGGFVGEKHQGQINYCERYV